MAGQTTPTFREILEQTRWECTRRTWERAVTASRLRHTARAARRFRAARTLGDIKMDALARICQLAPRMVKVRLDRHACPGLYSLALKRLGALHIRPGAEGAILALLAN